MKIQDKAKTVEIHSPKIRLPKHGYTRIELKDPYTCRKQVFESENMLTNAVENYFANAGLFNNIFSSNIFQAGNVENLVPYFLGGVMLFDDEIPENANNTGIPAANMTANMAVDVTNNTNPPELGSYSATESGWQQDGSWVQVYNFTTTQGNGDIASACLSSRYLAGIGVGNRSNTRKNISNLKQQAGQVFTRSDSNLLFFKIDYANSIGYAVDASDISAGIANGSTIRVYKYLIPLTIIDIKNKWKLLDTYTYSVSGIAGISSRRFTYNSDDGKFVIVGINQDGNWSSSYPVQIVIIDESGIQSYQLNNPPISGLIYNMNDNIHVFENAAYFVKRTGVSDNSVDPHTIYKMRLSDGALLSTITVNVNTFNIWKSSFAPAQQITSKQYVVSGSSSEDVYIYDFTNDRILLCNGIFGVNNNRSGKIIGADGLIMEMPWGRNTDSFYVLRNMYKIMSINNLDSPVTKTPDKTMKVTYRITF